MNASWSVVKIGGSLLERPTAAAELRSWLDAFPADQRLLLFAGGGELVEAIRRLDERFQLGEERCHGWALTLLETTAEILAAMLSLPLLDTIPSTLPSTPRNAIFQPGRWLRMHEAQSSPPWRRSWETTSDSLAAVLATELDAELVLLKSRPPAASASDPPEVFSAWAAEGIVDSYFPTAAARLRAVRIETLPPSFHEANRA